MPLIPLILTAIQIAGMVQRGLASAKAVAEAVQELRLEVVSETGEVLTAADVEAHVQALVDAAGAAGDAAAARVEGRHT